MFFILGGLLIGLLSSSFSSTILSDISEYNTNTKSVQIPRRCYETRFTIVLLRQFNYVVNQHLELLLGNLSVAIDIELEHNIFDFFN